MQGIYNYSHACIMYICVHNNELDVEEKLCFRARFGDYQTCILNFDVSCM